MSLYAQQMQQAGMIGGPAAEPAQPSLTQRLQAMVAQVEALGGLAFDTSMRLGILQPVLSGVAASGNVPTPPRPNHTTALLSDLERAVSNLTVDIERIRSFAG